MKKLIIIIMSLGTMYLHGQQTRYYKKNGKIYLNQHYRKQVQVHVNVNVVSPVRRVSYSQYHRGADFSNPLNASIAFNGGSQYFFDPPVRIFRRNISYYGADFSNPWNATLAFNGGSQYFFHSPLPYRIFRRRY